MIHAYHATFGTYGSWFPNDPRGSASRYVGSKQLYGRGGSPDRTQRMDFARLTQYEKQIHRELQTRLKRIAVVLSDEHRLIVAKGMEGFVTQTNVQVWAAAIMHCHVHLVFARCGRKAETIVDEIKATCERELGKLNCLPVGCDADNSIWADGRWISFLDTDEKIDSAIAYVMDNPVKEGREIQRWPFVVKYPGIEPNIVSYND